MDNGGNLEDLDRIKINKVYSVVFDQEGKNGLYTKTMELHHWAFGDRRRGRKAANETLTEIRERVEDLEYKLDIAEKTREAELKGAKRVIYWVVGVFTILTGLSQVQQQVVINLLRTLMGE